MNREPPTVTACIPEQTRHKIPARAGLLGLACSNPDARLSPDHAQAIRDSVASTLGDFRRCSAAGQWDSLLRLYASDTTFRWIEEGKVVARSAADISRGLHQLPATMRVDNQYHDTEIFPLAPGVAEIVTDFQMTMADSGKSGFSFSGAMSLTMVHHRDGWQVILGNSSGTR